MSRTQQVQPDTVEEITVQELRVIITFQQPRGVSLKFGDLPDFWQRLTDALAPVLPRGCRVTCTGIVPVGMDSLDASLAWAEREEALAERPLAEAKPVDTVRRFNFGLTVSQFIAFWQAGNGLDAFELKARHGKGLVLVRTNDLTCPTGKDYSAANLQANPQVRIACRTEAMEGRFLAMEIPLRDFVPSLKDKVPSEIRTAWGRLTSLVDSCLGQIGLDEAAARAWVGVPAVGS